MSELFLRTLRDDPADAEVPSHKLLIRAGYVRPIGPGLYSWLPLGLRVLRRIEAIVREESVENVEEALLSLEGMDTDVASKLAANGIVTRDGLADLAVDELTELTGMAAERAQDLIMKARAHWFEPAAETATGA